MSSDIEPISPDLRTEIAQAAQSVPAQVQALAVTDLATFAQAGLLLRQVRAFRDKLSAWMDPQIRRATEAKAAAERARKGLADDKALLDGPLQQAEALLAARLGAYEDAQEAARRAEEDRLRRELAQKADERALADAVALEAAAYAAPTPEAGAELFAEAEAILDEPAVLPTLTLPRATPKVPGLSRPQRWEAEVVNLDALLTALVGGKLDKALAADLRARLLKDVLPTPLMNQQAAALRQALRIPGVRAVRATGYRLRS